MGIVKNLLGIKPYKIQVQEENRWIEKSMDRGQFVQQVETALGKDGAKPSPELFTKLSHFVQKNMAVIKNSPDLSYILVGDEKSTGKLGDVLKYLEKQLEAAMPSYLNNGIAGGSNTDAMVKAIQAIKNNINDLTENHLSLNVRDGSVEVTLNQMIQGVVKLIDAPDISTRNLTITINGKTFREVGNEPQVFATRIIADSAANPAPPVPNR